MRSGILFTVVLVVVFLLIVGLPAYFVSRWMSKRMTKTEMRMGYRNALICGAGLLGLAALGSLVISHLFGRSFRDSLSLSLNVLWGTCLIGWVVAWQRGYAAAGPVLLDCGPHPTRGLFRFNAALGVVLGLASIVNSRGAAGSQIFSGAIFWLTMGAFFLALSLDRLQLRHNGVWQYGGLLRWEKIESFHWKEQSTLVVKTTHTSWMPWIREGALSVPPHLKEEFDRIWRQHVQPYPSV